VRVIADPAVIQREKLHVKLKSVRGATSRQQPPPV
jgi:hypothetical protein